MMRLQKYILGVKQFYITDQKKVYIVSGEKISNREVFFEEEKIIDITKVYSLNYSSRGVFVNTIEGAHLFDDHQKIDFYSNKMFKGEINKGFVFEELINNAPFLKYKEDKLQVAINLTESSSILHFEHDSAYKVIFDENLSMKSLVKFSVSGFEWEFSLKEIRKRWSEELRVRKILGSVNSQLWVALNNHTVISLNIKTGELTKQFSAISSFKCDWLPSAIPAPEAIQIDKRRNCLVGFMWEFYWEINIETTEIKFYDLTNYLKEQKIRNDKPDFVLGEKHIYFISQNKSKLGALNLETKKIDWVYSFEENENGFIPEILELKGHDLLLGALDRNNTLHIFEKE